MWLVYCLGISLLYNFPCLCDTTLRNAGTFSSSFMKHGVWMVNLMMRR